MSEKKRPRGRPKGSGKGSSKAMFSRRVDAKLLQRFQAYVATISPRTTDTAVLELAIQEYLVRHAAPQS